VPLGDPTDLANAALVSSVVASNWPAMLIYLHPVYTLEEVKVYPLGSPLVPAQITALAGNGGSLGPEHFKQISALIKHVVIRRGKGSQSHTFLSPLSGSDITANGDEVTTSYVTNGTLAFDGFIQNCLIDLATAKPGTWTYVQVSPKHSTTFDIASSAVEPKVASSRRRNPR
jgi:hypothetical protein